MNEDTILHLAIASASAAATLYVWRIHRTLTGSVFQPLTESLTAAFIISTISHIVIGIGHLTGSTIARWVGEAMLLAAFLAVLIGAQRVAKTWQSLQTAGKINKTTPQRASPKTPAGPRAEREPRYI